MLDLSRRDGADVSVAEIDDALSSLAGSLDECHDPFDRFRILQSIDVQLDRRLVAMAGGGSETT